MKGVFLDYKTLDHHDLDFSVLTSTLEKWKLHENTSRFQILDRIRDAAIVVTNKVPMTYEVMEQVPDLRCICVAATGCDHIDLHAAGRRGITVCNVVGYSKWSVVQHAIGLMIACASKIIDYDKLVKQGEWVKSNYFCLQNFTTIELAGKILGIIGYGDIGQGVAKVASQLGMQVLIAQRPGKADPNRIPLSELLPQVDVLSLHCPLNQDTRHMIGKKELSLLKKGAILLNVSRGGLIDEQALREALLSGQIFGAGLDVSATEPPNPDSPLLSESIPNLILTPHVAWSTFESRKRLLNEIADNIKAFIANKPTNVVKVTA